MVRQDICVIRFSRVLQAQIVKGLVTNYGEGGATKREGGRQVKFYPYEKGGGRKSFSHAEGGGSKRSFGVVFIR